MTKREFLAICRQVGRDSKEFKGDDWKSYMRAWHRVGKQLRKGK